MKRLGMTGLLIIAVAASALAQQQSAGKEEIPAQDKPPKGMCRIWLKDVPPAQQPAPTDCAAAVKNVPTNGRVVFGDATDDKKEKAKPELPKEAKSFAGKSTPPPAVVVPKKPPR